MKRLLFSFLMILLSLSTYAQQWIDAAESSDAYYYVNSTLRHRGSYYIAFVKCVPKNITEERNRRVAGTGESKWYRYAYYVVTEMEDVEEYRSKSLHFSYYDTDGSVLDAFNSTDDSWSYAKPNSIGEAVIETVEYIARRTQ